MLAKDYIASKFKTNGSYMSIKYDGVRCLWCPNTRSVNWRSVPFANTTKDDREGLATGLWSRKGKPIPAPNWFLDQLPEHSCLDGELWEGVGKFQKTVGEVKKKDGDWSNIKYMVYDRPALQRVFQPGDLEYTVIYQSAKYEDKERRFSDFIIWCTRQDFWNNHIQKAPQYLLSGSQDIAEKQVEEKFAEVLELGHEGLMLRRAYSVWEPIRSTELVKVKPVDSGAGAVVGYEPGKGKYAGMIGSLLLSNGAKVSGMLDSQRELDGGRMVAFTVGQTIQYNYNGKTKDGNLRHPRLKREKRDD